MRPLFEKYETLADFLHKVYREKIFASPQNSEDSTISIEQWLLPTTMSKLLLGCPGTTYVRTYVRNKYSQSCEPSIFGGPQIPKFWHLTVPMRRYKHEWSPSHLDPPFFPFLCQIPPCKCTQTSPPSNQKCHPPGPNVHIGPKILSFFLFSRMQYTCRDGSKMLVFHMCCFTVERFVAICAFNIALVATVLKPKFKKDWSSSLQPPLTTLRQNRPQKTVTTSKTAELED